MCFSGRGCCGGGWCLGGADGEGQGHAPVIPSSAQWLSSPNTDTDNTLITTDHLLPHERARGRKRERHTDWGLSIYFQRKCSLVLTHSIFTVFLESPSALSVFFLMPLLFFSIYCLAACLLVVLFTSSSLLTCVSATLSTSSILLPALFFASLSSFPPSSQPACYCFGN